MTATNIFAQNRMALVSGKGFSTVGSVTVEGGGDVFAEKAESVSGFFLTLLLGGCLCNNTQLIEDEAGKISVKGSSSEAPLVVAAAKLNMAAGVVLERQFPRVDEVPFNSKRKLMATLHRNAMSDESVRSSMSPPFPGAESVLQSAYFSAIKGAPNYVLGKCTRQLGPDGSLVPMNAAERKRLLAVVDELSSRALRVLAVAYAPMDRLPYEKADEGDTSVNQKRAGGPRKLGESAEDVTVKLQHMTHEMVFAGFAASIDPPRDGIKVALETAHTASIRTVMITGLCAHAARLRRCACVSRDHAFMSFFSSVFFVFSRRLPAHGCGDCEEYRSDQARYRRCRRSRA